MRGCIYVASVNSGALGPFTPVDPEGLIYLDIVALASVLRGVVSFRGPGRRAGCVFMQS